VEESKDVAE